MRNGDKQLRFAGSETYNSVVQEFGDLYSRALQYAKKSDRTSLILTRFALHSHPRFIGGSYSNFIGWSKPRIEVYEVGKILKKEPVRFANRQVEFLGVEHDTARLRFTELNSSPKSEIRQYIINKPVSTGHDPDLYDASCEYFIGCWTSSAIWRQYYLRTILVRQHEINISRLQSVPSLFTKRAFMFYYNRCKYLAEDVRDRLRSR